jgi:hypothetical protein
MYSSQFGCGSTSATREKLNYWFETTNSCLGNMTVVVAGSFDSGSVVVLSLPLPLSVVVTV